MEWAADLGADSWPVVGKTVDALQLFVAQRQVKGIHRGHTENYGRRNRAKGALEAKMTKDQLVLYFREQDRTVLITVAEQREWSHVIPIHDSTLFRGDGTVRVTKKNLKWAEQTAAVQGL